MSSNVSSPTDDSEPSAAIEVNYPSLLRRFAIINYDLLLLMAVSMAYGIVYLGIAKLIFQMETDRASGLLFQLGWPLTIFLFFCYFWKKGGQTTGMRAWRVQLLTAEGTAPTIAQCALRFLLALIGWLLFFSAWFDDNRQLLHDRWSKTQLILLPKIKK